MAVNIEKDNYEITAPPCWDGMSLREWGFLFFVMPFVTIAMFWFTLLLENNNCCHLFS